MPKPYSSELRDRVIDAVERDGMSCVQRRAATRSATERVKRLERHHRGGSREPVATDLIARGLRMLLGYARNRRLRAA